MASSFLKDPDAVLDYMFDWSSWLQSGETISTSTMTASTGITVDSDVATTTTTTVWLSGGTAGETYEVTNHITTSNSRAEDRTITIVCLER